MKKSHLVLIGTLLLSTFHAAPALADSFDFTFSFTGDAAGSGVFVADTTSTPGQYLITGISGTVNNVAIGSLIDPGGYPPGFPNDNLLFYPGNPNVSPGILTFLDDCGFSFADASGTDYNIYFGTFNSSPFGYQFLDGPDGSDGGSLSSFSVGPPVPVVTPEPQSLLLVGTGLLGALGMLRRRLLS